MAADYIYPKVMKEGFGTATEPWRGGHRAGKGTSVRPDKHRTKRWTVLAMVAAGAAAQAWAQQSSSFQGSVPSGTASSTALSLTLEDAIQRGLKSNLGLLLRDSDSRASRAQRLRALAALRPQITASFSETEEQLNLRTLGFSFNFPPIPGFSGIPAIVGPFHYTDARASVSATIFNYNQWKTLKSAKESEQAAALSVNDARDLVVQGVVNGYLLLIADASRLRSLDVQEKTAQALYDRAVDRKSAGTSPAIDVLRAAVELKQDQQKVLAQRNQLDKDKLGLARVIGLPAGQVFELAQDVPFTPMEAIEPEAAVRLAYRQRPDYQSARRQVAAAEEAVKAAHGQWYPTVALNGFYGANGPAMNDSHGVFEVSGAVNFNIFDGGRIHSDEEQARATLKQRSDELADLGGQIDYQVRSALLDVKTAADLVAAARTNLDLADQTLEQARDRFSAGVADNIEVVQAQQSVANANDSLIAALYAHNAAKAAVARALGMTEQGIKKYIEVK